VLAVVAVVFLHGVIGACCTSRVLFGAKAQDVQLRVCYTVPMSHSSTLAVTSRLRVGIVFPTRFPRLQPHT